MLAAIGRIVARARTAAGLSRDELAAKTSTPTERIADVEEGRPGLTTTQLSRVADALNLDEAALVVGVERSTVLTPSVFLRHATIADFDHDDLAIMDRAIVRAGFMHRLGALLASPRVALPNFREPAAERAAREGYDLARAVRAAIGSGEEPLDDLRVLAEERLDIAVLVEPLRSTRATAVGVRLDAAAAIVLNANDPERARNPLLARVHIAHELCHLLFDPSEGGLHMVVDIVADRRDLRAERRARGFAAELLLPQVGLISLLGAPRAVREPSAATKLVTDARHHFYAPHEITAHHLCNHGFIDHSLHDWIASPARASMPPSNCTTTLPSAGAPPLLLVERVRRAHALSLITDGEARTALDLDVLMPLPWD